MEAYIFDSGENNFIFYLNLYNKLFLTFYKGLVRLGLSYVEVTALPAPRPSAVYSIFVVTFFKRNSRVAAGTRKIRRFVSSDRPTSFL